MTISKLDQECERAHAEHRATHSRSPFTASAIMGFAGYPQHMIDKEREREAAADPYERYRRHKAGVLAAVRALIADDVTTNSDGEGQLPDAAVQTATAFLLDNLDAGDAFELISETNFDLCKQLAKVMRSDKDAAALMVMAMQQGAMEYAKSAYLDDIIAAIAAEQRGDASGRLFSDEEADDRASRAREMRAAVPHLLSERL